jgi:hypothetical protein
MALRREVTAWRRRKKYVTQPRPANAEPENQFATGIQRVRYPILYKSAHVVATAVPVPE